MVDVGDLQTGWACGEYAAQSAMKLVEELSGSKLQQLIDAIESSLRRQGPLSTVGYLGRRLSAAQRNTLESHGGATKILQRMVSDGRLVRSGTEYGIAGS